MVNKVEKIKIEDESNGNGNAVTLDVTDNNLTDEIDNSFEDEEQVSGSVTLNISVTRFYMCYPQSYYNNIEGACKLNFFMKPLQATRKAT